MSESEAIPLNEAIVALEKVLSKSSVSPQHLWADLSLVGFARDVYQHANAVALILASDFASTAFASARAVHEAFLDAAFLATRDSEAEDGYDFFGARARCAELLDWQSLQTQADGFSDALGRSKVDAEAQMERDAAAWEGWAAGRRDLMKRAWDEVLAARQQRRSYHWSGHGRRGLVRQVVPRIASDGELDGAREFHLALYSFFSYHTHPAPRIERKYIRLGDDRVRLALRKSGGAQLIGIIDAATVAALQVTTALVGMRLVRAE